MQQPVLCCLCLKTHLSPNHSSAGCSSLGTENVTLSGFPLGYVLWISGHFSCPLPHIQNGQHFLQEWCSKLNTELQPLCTQKDKSALAMLLHKRHQVVCSFSSAHSAKHRKSIKDWANICINCLSFYLLYPPGAGWKTR